MHYLKTLPQFFEAVAHDKKPFEVRFNDRNFQVGDTLVLCEWNGEEYTERTLVCEVTYIADLAPVLPGWVGMTIRPQGIKSGS